MARARVLILGGGFGGVSAAHALIREAGDAVEVIVVDRSPSFAMGLRKLWLLDGRSTRGEGARPRAAMQAAGVSFRLGTVEAIDRAGRSVRVDGEDAAYDYLILALGAEPRPDLVPGGLDGAENLYSFDGAASAAGRLSEMEAGRIVIAIAGLPYKCPPAPYEAAFLIDAALRLSGRRDAVEIEVLSPQPMSIPAAGPVACSQVEGRLSSKGIRFRPKSKVESVEGGRVALEGGERVEADLLIAVPPHRPPPVVADTGLGGEAGWIGADPATLATSDERVYAIGDLVEMTTGAGMPFPKAGVFAERHGEVVGRNVAALLTGREPAERFDGFGYCFLEVGEGVAAMVRGRFLDSPPDVTIEDPSPEHLEAKVTFERERLERWFPE